MKISKNTNATSFRLNLLVVWCSIFFTSTLFSASPFEDANAAFAKKDYATAIKNYEQILGTGQYSADLYFNLGNAYLKNKKLGKAILNFERAAKYDSGDPDIQHNLAIAKESIIDDIEPLPPFFIMQFFGGIRDIFSSTGWAVFSLFFLWIGFGVFILKMINKLNLTPSLSKIIGISALVLAGLGTIFGIAKTSFDKNHKEAIIIQNAIDFKTAPDEISENIMDLHEGTKVVLIDKIEDWYKVKLADGDEGWIQEGDLEVI